MKLCKKILGSIFIVVLVFNLYKIAIGESIFSQLDVGYLIGGVWGILLSISYSFWLISSAFNESKYKEPGNWVLKYITLFCMASYLAIILFGFYSNLGKVELVFDLIALFFMLSILLPIMIYDLKLIIRSRYVGEGNINN